MAFDIGLDINGDIPIVAFAVTGLDLVVQRLQVRLRLQLGTFIGDQTKGLDFLTALATRPFDVVGFGGEIRATIEDTPEVGRVFEFDSEQDGSTIRYTARVAIELESEAETDLIQLDVALGVDAVGNSHPAIITYQRLGRIAPLGI